MLYIVPTPIGNLKDITFRAIEVLQEVDLILAEDTRKSSRLLKEYDIQTPLQSFHAHNEHKVLEQITEKLKSGATMALVSDAGSPGISDPGYLLANQCAEQGLDFTCLPGANAIVPALVASGFPCDKFYFEGFLPVKKGRKKRLEYLSQLDQTIVLFESPHKIKRTLTDLLEYFDPTRNVCLAREISKMHEEFLRLPLQELQVKINEKAKIKGEITLVISKAN